MNTDQKGGPQEMPRHTTMKEAEEKQGGSEISPARSACRRDVLPTPGGWLVGPPVSRTERQPRDTAWGFKSLERVHFGNWVLRALSIGQAAWPRTFLPSAFAGEFRCSVELQARQEARSFHAEGYGEHRPPQARHPNSKDGRARVAMLLPGN